MLRANFKFTRIGVHADDTTSFGLTRTLNHRQPNTAQTKDPGSVALLDLCRIVYRADTGGDAATEQLPARDSPLG